MSNFEVVKRMNNNTVIAKKSNNQEVVLIGKGLGFQVYPGHIVEKEDVERIFVIESEKNKGVVSLLETLPENIVSFTHELVNSIENQFDIEFNSLLIVNLADHLDFYMKRKESNNFQISPLENEIMYLYPKEYKMAKYAIKYIKENLIDQIDDSETGYIAMHFINTQLGSTNQMHETLVITRVLSQIVGFIENEIGFKFDYESLNFSRLTTHLKFFVIRQLRSETSSENIMISEKVSYQFKKEYELAKKVVDFTEKSEGWVVSEGEILYLTLHLIRIINGGK